MAVTVFNLFVLKKNTAILAEWDKNHLVKKAIL